jgi:hypothetical protein
VSPASPTLTRHAELHEELGVEVTAVSDAEFVVADPDSPFLIAFAGVHHRSAKMP